MVLEKIEASVLIPQAGRKQVKQPYSSDLERAPPGPLNQRRCAPDQGRQHRVAPPAVVPLPLDAVPADQPAADLPEEAGAPGCTASGAGASPSSPAAPAQGLRSCRPGCAAPPRGLKWSKISVKG